MGIKIISENKKARFDYHILETYEAGLVLKGSEVKSLRAGQCNLKDSYVSFKGVEAFLQNVHISVYKASSYNSHSPERLRKLLLHRHELNQIYGALREKGLSCIPIKLYFKKGMVKVELGLGRGKKTIDKRESIRKRQENREMQSRLRHSKKLVGE